ncbi:MAG: acetyl-CoA C-acyltransferase [Bacteroidales bacterium]|nr:acetyl-CoA C-acyltransferase [Bacteroidales bacterium]MBN2758637.1 acetyl-CoA C-acyltransferase [Bacteroidales bacterium]
MQNSIKNVVIIDGTRTPFLRSGTDYQDMMSYELGAAAIKALVHKTAIDKKLVEQVIMGTVIHNIRTPNVARESMIIAGLLPTTPAHTVSQACISANVAISQVADMIRLGTIEVAIAGGTDSVSDIPIAFNKKMRKKLFNSRKIKSPIDSLKFLASLRFSDFKPDVPDITEFTTGLSMGQDADILAARLNISRREQDEYAVRSHQFAFQASENELLAKEITSIETKPKNKVISKDNTYRSDSSIEKLSKLKPAFDKKYGTITAANSSFLTDGASAVLLMEEEKARQFGYKAKARIKAYTFVGRNPKNELLLGPAYAIPKVLKLAGLKLEDIGVFEIHEAFAAQTLAILKLLNSDKFGKENLGLSGKLGEIPMDKLNLLGGSLSLGHPFGATGGRLLTTAANRLILEDKQFAVLAACAAGGHGHAMVIERI